MLLNAATTTGPSSVVDLGYPHSRLALNVSFTGNPSAVVVTLEGANAIAGSNPDTGAGAANYSFTEIARFTHNPAAGTPSFSAAPALAGSSAYAHSPGVGGGTVQGGGAAFHFVRVNLLTLTGGTNPTVTAGFALTGADNNAVMG